MATNLLCKISDLAPNPFGADHGAIVAWGNNTLGICNVPEPNTGLVAVSGGESHALALRFDGSFIAWGRSPNPCTGPATIRYQIDHRSVIDLRMFDAAGQAIRTLAHGPVEVGTHSVDWNAKGPDGSPMPAGIYYLRLATSDGGCTCPIVVLR